MNLVLKKELEESIGMLKNGGSVKIDEFVLGMSRSKDNLKEFTRLEVNGYAFYKSMKDVPKSIIKDELMKVKETFTLIMEESLTFKAFATNIGIDYFLVLDYKTGGVVICSEIEGKYKEYI